MNIAVHFMCKGVSAVLQCKGFDRITNKTRAYSRMILCHNYFDSISMVKLSISTALSSKNQISH